MARNPICKNTIRNIRRSYEHLRPQAKTDAEVCEIIASSQNVSAATVRKYTRDVEAYSATVINDIDSENPLGLIDYQPMPKDLAGVLDIPPIGWVNAPEADEFYRSQNVAPLIEKTGEVTYWGGHPNFTPETSSDYEIKAPEVKKAFEATTEHHELGDEMERWLILPDIHVPLHDTKTIDAVLEYASENYYSGVVQLGDYMDWDWISRYTKENARAVEGRRFLEEYIPANALLDEIQSVVRNRNPNAKIVMLEGNHDWRVENVIDKTPALQGLIEMDKNLRLDERNITYWRYWTHRKPYIIGKAYFIHGLYIGNNHAKKTADNFGKCVFYGHTHDRSSHPKTTFDGSSVFCESFGTLSIQEMPYMGKNPSNWSQCFAEFFFRPDGTFNHYVTNIINNRFIGMNGKEYGEK